MSNLKDTDMDDLFRRASDKYPLRTDSSDWDRMAAALEKDPPPPADGTDTTDRRKKRRFFWLFFLLPLAAGGLGYYTWHSGAKSKIVTTTTNISTAANPPEANAPATTNTAVATQTPGVITGAPAPIATAATATGATTKAATQTAATKTVAATTVTGIYPDASPATAAGSNNSNRDSNHRFNSNRQTKTGPFLNSADTFADANTNVPADANRNNNDNLFSTSLTQIHQGRLFYDLQRAPIDRNYDLKVNVAAPVTRKDSNTPKQNTSKKTKTSYLYAGIIGAPDLSTVKMQAIKGTGNTFGVLVGWAFNSHWAIETGSYVERKKYYTEGEYFNTKEIPTSYDTLKTVNGTCYMWEIPINVRYTFNPEGKTKWFATAGFSTYLMTSERYNYVYEKSAGGTSWPENGSKNIDSSSRYPFSIVNLTVGFEQRLGKVGNLRIEPYLRIPLTGMGTGKLPIMSTGINIGITRQLWKK